MRKKVNDYVIVFDGNTEYKAIITDYSTKKKTVSLVIASVLRSKENSKYKKILFASVVKNSCIDNIVQKSTELGIDSINLICTEYSQKHNINLKRLHKIAIEASEQSNRISIPKINYHKDFKLADISTIDDLTIIFTDENNQEDYYIKDFFDNTKIDDIASSIAVLIGPEGGFSQQERHLLKSFANCHTVTLGKTILRSDTAVSCAISCVNMYIDNLPEK